MKTDKTDVKKIEDDFKLIGLNAFFNTEDDNNVNWKDFFLLSEDEQFYLANNNQIIDDDKNEDDIWRKYEPNHDTKTIPKLFKKQSV